MNVPIPRATHPVPVLTPVFDSYEVLAIAARFLWFIHFIEASPFGVRLLVGQREALLTQVFGIGVLSILKMADSIR